MSWDKEWLKRSREISGKYREWNTTHTYPETGGHKPGYQRSVPLFDPEGIKYSWDVQDGRLRGYFPVSGKNDTFSVRTVGTYATLQEAEMSIRGTAIPVEQASKMHSAFGAEEGARNKQWEQDAINEAKRRKRVSDGLEPNKVPDTGGGSKKPPKSPPTTNPGPSEEDPDLVANRRADQQNADAAKRTSSPSSEPKKKVGWDGERVTRKETVGVEGMRAGLDPIPQRAKIGATYTDVVNETSVVIDDIAQQSWGGRMVGRAERFRRKAQNILTGRLTSTLSGDALESVDMEFLAGTIGSNRHLNKAQLTYATDLIMGMKDTRQLQDLANHVDKNFNIDTGHLPVVERIEKIKDLLLKRVSKNRVTYKSAVLQTKRVINDGIPEAKKAQFTAAMRRKLSSALGTMQGFSGAKDPDAAARAKDMGVFWFNTGRTNQSVPWKHGRLTIDYNRPVTLRQFIDEFDKRDIDRVLKNPWSFTKDEMEILDAAGIQYEYGGAKVGDLVSIRPVKYTRLAQDGQMLAKFMREEDGKRILFVMKKNKAERRNLLKMMTDKAFNIDIETNAFETSEELALAEQKRLAMQITEIQAGLGTNDEEFFSTMIQSKSRKYDLRDSIQETWKKIFMDQGWGKYTQKAVLESIQDENRFDILRRAAVAAEISNYVDASTNIPRITELSGVAIEAVDVVHEGSRLRQLASRMAAKVSGYRIEAGAKPLVVGNGFKVVSPEDMAKFLDALEAHVEMNYEIFGVNLQRFDNPAIRLESYFAAKKALSQGNVELHNRLIRHSGEARIMTREDVSEGRLIGFVDELDGKSVGAVAVRNRSTDIQKTLQMFMPITDEDGIQWMTERAIGNVEKMARGEGHRIVFGPGGTGDRNADEIVHDIRLMFGQGEDWDLKEIFERAKIKNMATFKNALRGDSRLEILSQVEDAYVSLQSSGTDNIGLRASILENTLGYKARGAGGSLDFFRLALFDNLAEDAEYIRALKRSGLYDSLRHSSGRDVIDTVFMLNIGIRRFMETGELSFVTPQTQAGPAGRMQVFENDVFEVIQDITRRLGGTPTTAVAAARVLPEQQMLMRLSSLEDVFLSTRESLNEIQKAQLGQIAEEFSSFGQKLMNPLTETSIGRQAVIKLGDEWASLFNISLEDGVQRANKIVRGAGIAAIIGAAAYIVGTSVSKHNDQEDTTWRYSHKTYAPEQLRTMEERIAQAQVGQMAIQSHYRKNYAYNMNNNKHDHLFRGV
jgi:hypothetical protein